MSRLTSTLPARQVLVAGGLSLLLALPLHAQSASEALRRADSAFAAEDRALAGQLYRQVLESNPDQSRAVYRLGVLSHSEETAMGWFKRYVTLEPGDAWGWLALGDRSLRVGKTVEAKDAYQRAATLEPKVEEVLQRLERGKLRAAPTLEPLGGYVRDSDGNSTWKYGLDGDFALRGGWRLGLRGLMSRISDGLDAAAAGEGLVRLEGRPRQALRVDLAGGVASLTPSGGSAWLTAEGDARLRWRGKGAGLELRAQRLPLGTTPLLVGNHVMRNEGRLGIELPVGPLRIRGTGHVALIEAVGEDANRRLQGDGALALPLGWRGEISAQYHRLGFERASTAGYFAPGRVETVEAGTYWELGGDGAVSLSFDLGAGVQRLAEQGADVGPWKPAFRGWAMFAVDLTRTLQWRTEAEAYNAPFAPVGVSTAPDWRYGAVTTSLLARIP